MNLRVRRIQDWQAAERLACRWNELSGDVPFRRWEWLANWWRHYSESAELYLLAIEGTDGRILGLAPWYCERFALSGRTIRLLGSGESCSDYLTVLVEPADRDAAVDALVRWLLAVQANSSDGWDCVQLESVSLADPVWVQLLTRLQEEACDVHCLPSGSCWRIDLSQGWDGLLRQLSKPDRRHLRRAAREVAEGRAYRVAVATTEPELSQAWEQLLELHLRRRRLLGRSSTLDRFRFQAFLHDASESLASAGRVRYVTITQGGDPVASLMTFLGSGTAHAYQMGIAPERLADSPGWLVVAAAIQVGLEGGESALDLLRGDEAYKQHMGARPRLQHDVRIIPPRLSAHVRHSAWLTTTVVQQWMKCGLALARHLPYGVGQIP